MKHPRILTTAAAFLSVLSLAIDNACAQQNLAGQANAVAASGPSTMLGRNSCAATTCHGGAVGETINWNNSLSVFEARDPHTDAGLALKNDLSRRIVEALQPESRDAPEVFQRVIRERCSGCHAPAMGSTPAAEAQVLADAAYVEGVSCEACHGPAAGWLEPHLHSDWQGGEGMRETASFVERVEGCVRCHVGSRQPGELVRDMNHDMIAAGHPPLRFDAWAYLRRLPSHWDEHNPREDGLPVDDPHPQLRRFVLGRLIAFHAAVDLTDRRVRDAGRGVSQSVWPELADFDCFACHQQLRIANMQAPVSPGFPRYNPWLESGIREILTTTLSDQEADRYQKLLERVRLRASKSSDVSNACAETNKLLARPLEIVAGQDELPPDAVAWHPVPRDRQSRSDSSDERHPIDWHGASFWFLRTQAYLADRDEGALLGMRTELSEVHDLLRFRPLAAIPGVVADSPAQFEPSAFVDRVQPLKAASSSE